MLKIAEKAVKYGRVSVSLAKIRFRFLAVSYKMFAVF